MMPGLRAQANADNIATAVVRGVYSNMYKLLRENLNAEQYVHHQITTIKTINHHQPPTPPP